MSKSRRPFQAAVLAFGFWALGMVSVAANPIMSAEDAAKAVSQGDIILLDIRSRQEWKESGIAKGAWPVSMHERDFSGRLQDILAKYDSSMVALICATGGRSDYVADVLEKNGITGVIDVSEGMFGNKRGKGWIADGLPVVTLEEAVKSYDAEMGLSN